MISLPEIVSYVPTDIRSLTIFIVANVITSAAVCVHWNVLVPELYVARDLFSNATVIAGFMLSSTFCINEVNPAVFENVSPA